MRDDIIYENEDVTEALRRLPKRLVDERNFRIVRAMQMDAAKKILPEEQWTKYEEVSGYVVAIRSINADQSCLSH